MITLHLGPMFAGKTTELIRLAKEEEHSVIFRPILDTRSPRYTVKTHDGHALAAVAVDGLDFVDLSNQVVKRVLVDEVQFFHTESTIEAVTRWSWDGIDVHLFGLSLTAEGQSWPTIAALCELPSIKRHMHIASCSICREPAVYTQRMTPWGGVTPENAIGGVDDYEPRCFDHWSSEPVKNA